MFLLSLLPHSKHLVIEEIDDCPSEKQLKVSQSRAELMLSAHNYQLTLCNRSLMLCITVHNVL